MDALIQKALVEQAVALATSLAIQAVQSGAMTAQQINDLWGASRTDWDSSWASWVKQQAAKVRT